jgi:WD40 repeat protein/tRNA A-37 threonylcarbamoyl transferase component Bud32
MSGEDSGGGPQVDTTPAAEEETLPATADIGPDDDTAVAAPGQVDHAPTRRDEPDPVKIGRFLVIRRIGAGGMGVVYAAYDEDLDRKVAVKLLRPDRAGGTDATSGKARLLREAQALARLSHPNVVHVYEVGTFEEQVFVAMEFIEGETLKKWQAAPDREWREVVDKYLAAGAGLAAAHHAGIIHRDFKPENVLVAQDGQVRVLDFGLAREAGKLDEPTVNPVVVTASSSQKALATPLTETGALMGTPAYMAPEQFHGKPTDARTDQFAFCISLFEGLYGERPFVGKKLAELAHAVVTGEVAPPLRYTKVPVWLHKLLLRGLSVRPDERYESVAELLEQLEAGLRRRSIGRALVAGGGLVAVLVVATIFGMSGAGPVDVQAERSAIESKFVHARAQGQELRRSTGRSTSVGEQWDRLVLSWARTHVDDDPTRVLAALSQLRGEGTDWLAPAQVLATAAIERGVAARTWQVEAGSIVVLSGDGSRAASSVGGELRELSMDSGDKRLVATGVRRAPLAYAADGRLAGVSQEGELVVWGPEEFRGPACRASELAWSPTGELYALCPEDVLLRWRPGEDEQQSTIEGIQGLVVWPDGESLALTFRDGAVRLRSADGKDVRELGRADPLGTLHGLPNGEGIVVRGQTSQQFSFADLSQSELPALAAKRGLASGLGSAAAVVIEGDGSATARDSQLEVRQRLRHGVEVRSVAVSQNGRVAATVGEDGVAQFWRLGDIPPMRVGGHASPVTRLGVTQHGQIVVGTDSGTVRVWDVETRRSRVFGQHATGIRYLLPSPDDRFLATASREPGVKLWAIENGELSDTIGAKSREGPTAIAWSPQGHRIAIGACQVDGSCPTLVHDLEADSTAVLGSGSRAASLLAFSEDGARLVALHPSDKASAPTEGSIWNVGSGDESALQIGRVGLPVTASFVSDGLRIAFAGNDDTELRVLRFGPDGGGGGVLFLEKDLRGLAADPVQPIVVLQSAKGTMTLWDLRDDAVVMVGEHEAALEAVVVRPDREQALVLDAAGRASVYELLTGESRQLLEAPQVVAWGDLMVGSAPDGTLRVWQDVVPREPSTFLDWVKKQTDARVDLTTTP